VEGTIVTQHCRVIQGQTFALTPMDSQ
jgi:hypothetical protein